MHVTATDWHWQQRVERATSAIDSLIAELPADVALSAGDLLLELEDVPSPRVRKLGFKGTLLGLFSGRPLRAPLGNDRSDPTVTLYLDNIWLYAGQDWERFEEEVRVTWMHELGHYIGLDEQDLRHRNLG